MVTGIVAAPGLCLDESRPTCDTVNETCGGDESHWCVKWDDSVNLCLEICEPLPDTCEEGDYCVPLTSTDTGEVIGGGCWKE